MSSMLIIAAGVPAVFISWIGPFFIDKVVRRRIMIYYKYEGPSPSRSHKANTAVQQSWYHIPTSVKNVATETGDGHEEVLWLLLAAYLGLIVKLMKVMIMMMITKRLLWLYIEHQGKKEQKRNYIRLTATSICS